MLGIPIEIDHRFRREAIGDFNLTRAGRFHNRLPNSTRSGKFELLGPFLSLATLQPFKELFELAPPTFAAADVSMVDLGGYCQGLAWPGSIVPVDKCC